MTVAPIPAPKRFRRVQRRMCGRWECAAALISFFSPCHTSFECAAWPEMYCSEALLPVGCMVPPAEPEECAAPSPVRSFALEQCRRRHDASATRAAAWNDPVTVTADVALWPEEETWLVVRDGVFSFSVQLAHELSQSHGRSIRLMASVLESEERHARVYRDSRGWNGPFPPTPWIASNSISRTGRASPTIATICSC
jgi:hypothetical protein